MIMSKSQTLIWGILLALVFLRPFLSEYAFLTLGLWYVFLLIFFSAIYLFFVCDKGLFSQGLDFLPVLFIVAISISVVFSGYTNWSLFELYLFIPNIIIYYITSRISRQQQNQLINTVFFAACVISAYAIYQYFIGFNHTVEYLKRMGYDKADELLIKKRVFGTMISPNIFVSYTAMMFFIGLGRLFANGEKGKIIHFLGISLITLALVFTKSLGGFFAFIIAFILFVTLSSRHLGFKRPVLKYAGLASFFVFISMFCLFAAGRIQQIFDLNNQNNPLIQRLYYWKASFGMIKDSPLVGIGWRKFGVLYETYKPALANISHYSHNVFLQILVETGLLGLVIFSLIVFIFLQKGIRVLGNNSGQKGLKIGLYCAGCVFLIHNLFDLSFYFGQVSFFWWIILGLIANFSSKKG